MEWRIIKDICHNGFMNMAIDEAIMMAHEKNMVLPTIRFYQWSPSAVTLGYFQDLKKEINIDVCRKLGIDIVRRPTGGKAVLHDQELTYSIIISEKNPLVDYSILKTYKRISQALINGLVSLGIKAELVPLKGKIKENVLPVLSQDSPTYKTICFSTPSQYEVQVDGKKLIGSAQVRKRGIVLQHGSLLIKLDREKLFSVFNFPSIQIKEKIKEKFKATCVNEIIKKEIDYFQLSDLLARGFAKEFGVKLIEGKLTNFEEKASYCLLKKKYSTGEWNIKKQYQGNIH